MYETADVLTTIDRNLPLVIALTLVGWVAGFVQIVEALRLGRRDRLPGAPAGMTVFLLAHDSTFFLRYDHWFHTVDHWYFQAFWVGMGIAVLIELVMVAQLLRYGRPALAPRLSPAGFLGLWLAFQVAAYVLLWWVQSLLDDPLYLVSLVGTQVAAVIFLVPFILVRGNARGQSMIYAWATLLGPASLALAMFPALCTAFRTPLYAGLCASMTVLALLYLALLRRYQAADAGAR
ncbi:MAG TPA: hypothetical protein VJM11_12695 [Nevskiaceae bacterium]|nr:hypothetical protein [Nevskiaceae bacterium]